MIRHHGNADPKGAGDSDRQQRSFAERHENTSVP
jgi:hypothetical protein